MSLVKVHMYDNKYLYRCDDCGYESHHAPVREHELGAPPRHSCPQAGRSDMKAILEEQDKPR